MKAYAWAGVIALCLWLAACRPETGEPAAPTPQGPLAFTVKGVVRELRPDGRTVVVAHEAIPNYMEAMTMPFKAKAAEILAGLQPGDEIVFRLLVSEDESWIDRIVPTGNRGLAAVGQRSQPGGPDRLDAHPPERSAPEHPPTAGAPHPFLDSPFTNQLGQAVSLSQFRGQALAITFFFTRCPIPEFCPRLSRNFQQAIARLKARPGAPTNWHFLSVTFDPQFDTPPVLKAYGERYQYDPRHWSFLTGTPEQIAKLAQASDVKIEREGDFYNHSFRTLIIDPAGRLQMSFPLSGDLSDAIVGELLKAAAVTNR